MLVAKISFELIYNRFHISVWVFWDMFLRKPGISIWLQKCNYLIMPYNYNTQTLTTKHWLSKRCFVYICISHCTSVYVHFYVCISTWYVCVSTIKNNEGKWMSCLLHRKSVKLSMFGFILICKMHLWYISTSW